MTAVPANPLDRIRPDVRAMHAYVVQDATGYLKLDAMENPYSLPPDLQAALGQRLGQLALNRYPGPRYAHVLVMRTLSKFGLAGVRIGYLMGAGGADRRDRQGAPALQRQRAQCRGGAVRAGARRRIRRQAAADLREQRERLQRRCAPARRAPLAQRGQHGAGARARCRRHL
jgi:histidinol-phosphate/aromatic aminotransferase/cobyric acid decarboxylase-like protein